jgi:hypothetical protein
VHCAVAESTAAPPTQGVHGEQQSKLSKLGAMASQGYKDHVRVSHLRDKLGAKVPIYTDTPPPPCQTRAVYI